MSSDTGSDSGAADANATPGADAVNHGFDAVPTALRERDTWVCWRTEDRDGDTTKVPVDPSTGGYASASDPDTWTSFDRARAYHADADTDTDGVGFVFRADDTVAGVDLDKCRDPDSGRPDDTARDVIGRLDSYTEVSPSGTGYHVYVFGFIPDGGNRRDGVEMYDDARFFTVTGDHVDGTPATVEQRADALRAVHADYVADDDGDDSGAGDRDADDIDGDLDDDALVSKAMDAENGDKFRRLWNGDTSGYPSHSEADLALCSTLAFWTGGDRARMDRLFRRSGLCRPKWTEREDYRRRTIDTALDGVSDIYDPDRENGGDVSTALPDDPTRPEEVASATADGRDGDPDRKDGDVDGDRDDRSDSPDVTLCPADVMAWAGLGKDDDLSDLNDRQKAACVWELLKHSDRYHVRVRRDNGSLWAYDDGVWTATGERALRHAAREALGSMNYGSNVLAELKAQARADPTVEVDADDLGLDPGHLTVENGLIDLDAAADGAGDDALRDLRPEDYALTRLPVEYNPDAGFERWGDHVQEWAEDGRADALQEYVGYCLHVGEIPIHRALLLVGTGANGKGTFLSVVRSLLGRENTSSIELQSLANERDAVADFYGALANIDDDLSARKLGQGLGMFKKLVGGDRVRARRLYEDGFEFDAVGKHLYAANEVPDVSVPDDDEAFWRRWLLVEFPNHYPPSKRDPDLRDELTADDVLSGVLNWAIDGRKRLLEQGYFTNEDEYAQAKRERWQAWGESVDKFIAECVDRDPDADRLTTADAHRRYAAWCRENGLDPVGQRKFTNTLKQEDVGYGRHRIDGSVDRGYKTLGLSDDVPDLDGTPERETPDDPDDPDDTRQTGLF
jgi:putative DNA primase/helicase